jgi:hypothetical protein
LIILLLRPMGPWFVRALLLLGSALGLIAPSVLRSPVTWFLCSALIMLRIGLDWPLADNHIYLLAYWTLALGLSLLSAVPSGFAARGARWLIGLAFLFAVIWKGVLSPEYRDGRFFAVTLLTDDRFADATMLLGGLSEAELEENRKYLEPLPEGAEWYDRSLHRTRAFDALVAGATWGTLAVESGVALTCLLALGRRWHELRHLFLLVFCIATYAFAPVAGFGWLVIVMGLAFCRPEQHRLRITYISIFFLVLLYSEIPWAGLILEWTGGT